MDNTFVTGVDASKEPIKIEDSDVVLVHRWKAHSDGINWVSYVRELKCIASASFDCNVYIWSPQCKKIGSLVLGTDKNYRLWDIKIDKTERETEEMDEA